MSNGWERIRLRVETKESLKSGNMADINETRTISCHILDTSLGKAAHGVHITLYRQLADDQWQELNKAITNEDGRVNQLLSFADFQTSVYKLKFDILPYFEEKKTPSFYPFIEVVVKCERGQHYHIPLLLSPFGYTTYRGS
ncbi:5-hydroxyisourate hydrolase [Haematobia irritans]|uniref:5-hydroxyisourate hydrolase n=2 Tax=Haematobia irritans TaxID=7368 RepID=A0A1L8EII9_HAEIR